MCHGRAEGVEVRWGGAKKLAVCFEVRTEPEAARLVKDISARPELAPLQIDFLCPGEVIIPSLEGGGSG